MSSHPNGTAHRVTPAQARGLFARLAPAARHIRWAGDTWVTVGRPLTPDLLRAHLEGREVLGAYPAADGTARFGVVDVDVHPAGRDPTPDEVATAEAYARRKSSELSAEGVGHLLLRGHDAGSFHLTIPTAPVPAARLGRWLLRFASDAGGVSVDTFPSPSGGGNAVRLLGRHHRRPDHWSAAWNGGGVWEPWPTPLAMLLELPDNPPACFPDPGEPGRGATGGADRGGPAGGRARPGDLFNLAVPVLDVLAARGWRVDREDGDRVRVTRPGKGSGVSASVKDGTVWVFTSSVPGLRPSAEMRTPYTAFALVAHLDFAGDFGAAAASLARSGFCAEPPGPRVTVGGGRAGAGRDASPPARYTPLPDYAPFPTACLPAPWDAFVREGAAALRCDEALVALPVLAALAAAVGNTRRVHLGAEWYEPAVLWTCVVAESGGRKSPAADLVMDLVKARQKRLVKEFKDQVLAYRRETAEYKRRAGGDDGDPGDPPTKPLLNRVLVSDTTIEKLAGLLDDNRRGLLLYRDELAGWVGSFLRYKAKGAGSDEPNWLSVHRADAIIYDRKTGDKTSVFVPHAAVSVSGGVQPGTLARLATESLFESGMVARILFAMPPRVPKVWTDDRISDATREAAARSLAALYELAGEGDEDGDPRPVVVKLTREARDRLKAFVDRWGLRQFEAEGARAAALAKLEALPGRFALIHHTAARAADLADTDPVGPASLEAGIRLAEWFAGEAERVYAVVSEPAGEKEVRKLVEAVDRLAGRNGGRVTVKTLQRANQRKYRTADLARADLERLVGLGLGRWEDAPERPGGGRRSTYFVPEPRPRVTDDDSDPSGPTGEGDPDPGDDSPDGPGTPPPPSPAGGATADPGGGSGESGAGDEREGSDSSSVTHDRGPEARTADPVGPKRPAAPQSPHAVGPAGGDTHPVRHLVRTTAGLAGVVAAVRAAGGPVGLDVETTGLRHHADRVRTVQVAAPAGTFVVDLFALPDPPAALSDLFATLARAGVVGHNLGFDLPFLTRLGFTPGAVSDTMLASRVLHAGDRTVRHGLKDAAAWHLGLDLDKDEQAADWAGLLTPRKIRYAALDAEVPVRLRAALVPLLADAGLAAVAAAEDAALPCVAWAARCGVGFDRAAWEVLATEAEARRAALRDRLDALAPGRNLTRTTNWDAPEQVAAAFAAAGVRLGTTGDAALAALDHPLAAAVREYRGAARLAAAYGQDWLRHAAPDGRVYPTWNQLGAGASGRMSCKDPNLQQLPRDPRYRRCFVAGPGNALVRADYSQIELRIAAKVSGDRRLLQAYRAGEDVHALTAAMILGKAAGDVTRADRQLAKAVNFGLLYGMGAKNLVGYARSNYGVALTEGEARGCQEAFFRTYPGLRRWHRFVKDGTQDTRTLASRRRAGVTAFTEKLNTPVQGTGADGLKRAMALLWERRGECPGAMPVLFIHDEIVVEAPEYRADAAVAWLKQAMVDGMQPLIDPVPVEVEVTNGPTWGG